MKLNENSLKLPSRDIGFCAHILYTLSASTLTEFQLGCDAEHALEGIYKEDSDEAGIAKCISNYIYIYLKQVVE